MSWLAGLFGTPFDDGGKGIWDLPNTSAGLSALQGEMTFNRMAMTMMGGVSNAFSAFSAAGAQDASFEREAKASAERAKGIRQQASQIMGAQAVGFAASGVDMSSGSAAKVVSMTEGRGNKALAIERDNAAQRMMIAGWRAAQYRGGAINGLLSAGMNAFGQYQNYQLDLAMRG